MFIATQENEKLLKNEEILINKDKLKLCFFPPKKSDDKVIFTHKRIREGWDRRKILEG